MRCTIREIVALENLRHDLQKGQKSRMVGERGFEPPIRVPCHAPLLRVTGSLLVPTQEVPLSLSLGALHPVLVLVWLIASC